jgi:hypothetical protein
MSKTLGWGDGSGNLLASGSAPGLGSMAWNWPRSDGLCYPVTHRPVRRINPARSIVAYLFGRVCLILSTPDQNGNGALHHTTPRCIWNHPHRLVLSCGSGSRRPPEPGRARPRLPTLQCGARSCSHRPTPAPRSPRRAAGRRGNPQAIHWPSTEYPQAFPQGRSPILERALRRPIIWPGHA